MLHRALEQFLSDVHWGELDMLLVDMPPGTGDVSISLGQLLPRAEAMIVTTPQPLAQEVAVRAAIDGAEDEHARDRRDREHDLATSSARAAASALADADRRAAARHGAARRGLRECRRRGRAARLGRARRSEAAQAIVAIARGARDARRGGRRSSRSPVSPERRAVERVLARIRALGFSEADAQTLADHFLDAERRGKPATASRGSSGSRRLPELDPDGTAASASLASRASSAGTGAARSAT